MIRAGLSAAVVAADVWKKKISVRTAADVWYRTMIEIIALFALYVVLIVVALYSIYYVFQQMMELLHDLLDEIHDERIKGYVEEEEKHDGSGQITRGAELSGSDGEHEAEEETE